MSTSFRRGMGRTTVLALTLGALTATLVAPVAEAASPKTKRVSVNSSGAQGTDGASFLPDITPDGRFIAFYSDSDQLSGKDSNGHTDIYVRDMKTKKTKLVSVHSNGAQGNEESGEPVISANGRFVAFETDATTLFNNDTNDRWDVLIRDRKKGKTKLVSKSSSGAKGDHRSFSPDITPDGRYVVLESRASNLVSGDTGGLIHIYIHDRKNGTTKLISKSSSGKRSDGSSSEPSVSADGRFVAFASDAKNLVNGDTNAEWDIFVHDRRKKRTTRVSVKSNGAEVFGDSTAAQISADGKIVAFVSTADISTNDINGADRDVYVHNRRTKTTKLASISSGGTGGNGHSDRPSISPDGRFVAFASDAGNLVGGDTLGERDVFIHDRKKSKTKRISVGKNGAEADGRSGDSSISSGGRFVAFDSRASNLIGSDTNFDADVFRRGPLR